MENRNSRFVNCTVIDALSTEPREVHIAVENGEIAEVSGSAFSHNSDIQTIDLRNKYLLPGLWDVHTHIGRGIPNFKDLTGSVDITLRFKTYPSSTTPTTVTRTITPTTEKFDIRGRGRQANIKAVSYTHLTLPTNREV